MNRLLFLLLILNFILPSLCYLDNLYCGKYDCYEVLGVSRSDVKADIARAYRKLARKFHPDIYKGEDAVEKFQLVATAYEILKDDESRQDYDYMLDNPEEAYYHYYRYYSHRMAPKVDVRIVIAVTISVISLLQYLHRWHRYNEAITYTMQTPRYKNQAMKIIHDKGLFEKVKGKGKISKEDRKEEENKILREVVLDSIDIRGGYSKPSFQDILWIQLLLSPYYLVMYIAWLSRWYWKFNIMHQPYDDTEKEYLTCKKLKLTPLYWEALDDYTKEDYLDQELWIEENFLEFKEQQEEEQRILMAESNRYKSYKRWLKRGGPGQMTFAED